MAIKKNLNETERMAWEQFDKEISCDNGHFPEPAKLGNCSVNIQRLKNKLCLEIMPTETTDMNGDVAGVIVDIDEKTCHLTSIIEMVDNAKKVEEAKRSHKPIKVFAL